MTVILEKAQAPAKPVYSPRDLLQQYHNLTIPWQFAENVVAPISSVKISKYLLADEKSERYQQAYARLKQAQRAHRSKRSKLHMEEDAEIQRAIRNAHDGKGVPADHITTMVVLIDAGICKPTQGSLQSYADKYLGMDCSGLVTAYFRARNRLGPSEKLKISIAYDSAVAERQSLDEVQQDDCLIWWDTDKDKVKTGYGHIAMVQRAIPATNNISVVEATGGGVGVIESDYTVEGDIVDGVFNVYRPRSKKHGTVKIVQVYH